MADKLERLTKIGEAMAALEQEAREEAEQRARPRDDDNDDNDSSAPSKPKHRIDGTPGEKTQRNFTEPESRILKTRDSYLQGYNAQAAVDAERQIIVATEVYAAQNDAPFLDDMLVQIRSNTGRQAREFSADYGYLSEANLRACRRRHVEPYIATGRRRHEDAGPPVRDAGQRGLASQRWRPSSAEQAAAAAIACASNSSNPCSVRSRLRSGSPGSCSAALRRYAGNGGSSPPRTTCGS